jgi:hypothetical protein
MNARNTDPQEDRRPLSRALIEARMPVLPAVDGEYKLVVSGGVTSWQTI